MESNSEDLHLTEINSLAKQINDLNEQAFST